MKVRKGKQSPAKPAAGGDSGRDTRTIPAAPDQERPGRPAPPHLFSPAESFSQAVTLPYTEVRSRIREVSRHAFPRKAVVLVISKGDPSLLDSSDFEPWHFPQTADRTYAGHYPEDSAAAIRHLAELCTQGAQFLLIPNPAFWWLSYYQELANYLNANYNCTWNTQWYRIYQLAPLSEAFEAVERGSYGERAVQRAADRLRAYVDSSPTQTDARRVFGLARLHSDGQTLSGTLIQKRGGAPTQGTPELFIKSATGEFVKRLELSEATLGDSRKRKFGWDFTVVMPVRPILESNRFALVAAHESNASVIESEVRFRFLFHIKADAGRIAGWVIDPDNPAKRVMVSLKDPDDEKRSQSCRATLFRGDLKDVTGRDGFFGFEFTHPPGADAHIEFRSADGRKVERRVVSGNAGARVAS